MSGWILALHTTTPVLGLGVMSLETGRIRTQTWDMGRNLAAQLHPCLQAFLDPLTWSDLEAIAVAVGPGSFTGSRLGVTVARTLGQSLGLPVYGISTLTAIAQATVNSQAAVSTQEDPITVAVQMDAQRGEWFGAIFACSGSVSHPQQPEVLTSERLWTDPDWQAMLTQINPNQVVKSEDYAAPVEAVATLAAFQHHQGIRTEWGTVLPNYGRQPPIDGG